MRKGSRENITFLSLQVERERGLGPSLLPAYASSICGRVGPELWPHCPGLTYMETKVWPPLRVLRLRYSYSSETGQSERCGSRDTLWLVFTCTVYCMLIELDLWNVG